MIENNDFPNISFSCKKEGYYMEANTMQLLLRVASF